MRFSLTSGVPYRLSKNMSEVKWHVQIFLIAGFLNDYELIYHGIFDRNTNL